VYVSSIMGIADRKCTVLEAWKVLVTQTCIQASAFWSVILLVVIVPLRRIRISFGNTCFMALVK